MKIERLDFVDSYCRCTTRFEELAARLCRVTSLKQVAELLELDWKTVKEIDKKFLEKQFSIPDYDGLRILLVDEIASHKGHNYFTVVMDLEQTRVVWIGKGRTQGRKRATISNQVRAPDIQLCLDIGNHIISVTGGRKPVDYADIFTSLLGIDAIDKNLSEVLNEMTRFRNRLVHLRWELDVEAVHSILQDDLTDLDLSHKK